MYYAHESWILCCYSSSHRSILSHKLCKDSQHLFFHGISCAKNVKINTGVKYTEIIKLHVEKLHQSDDSGSLFFFYALVIALQSFFFLRRRDWFFPLNFRWFASRQVFSLKALIKLWYSTVENILHVCATIKKKRNQKFHSVRRFICFPGTIFFGTLVSLVTHSSFYSSEPLYFSLGYTPRISSFEIRICESLENEESQL